MPSRKVLEEEERRRKEHKKQCHKEMLEASFKWGTIVGVIGLASVLGLNKYSPTFRNLSISFKTFIASSFFVAGFAIAGENKEIECSRRFVPRKRQFYDEVTD